MIRSLLLRGLRQHATLLLALGAGLFLFEWAVVWVAARIDMGPGFRQFLEALLPPDVLEVIFSQFGFGSFQGTVSFGFQHPFTLVAGIAMVTVLATVPAHERETGLLDLILARPLPRWTYLTASAIMVLLTTLLATLSVLGGAALGLAVVEPPQAVEWTAFLSSAGILGLLLLVVGAYGLLFATAARRRGVAVAQVVAVTLLFYWLDFMGEYWELLESARKLSPFHYFDPALAAESGVPPGAVMILAGVALVSALGAFLSFSRQDF
jgi:ABC-2 type transport system permease protein